MNILVTGGLGFIGSHTVVELLNEGDNVVIVDNLYNSKEDVLDKIKAITGKEAKFYKYDVTDREKVQEIFKENSIDAVIHFAGYKAVGESVKEPLMYYSNNLISTITLLETMKEYNVKRFIFSSSATVYGEAGTTVYSEDLGRGKTTNPYGTTKAMIEEILEDLYKSDNSWNITILRYFNPVGAHESGLIGEAPVGKPNNLMPYIVQVASGKLSCLKVFGNDYAETKDGTGVRDYIHVVDLSLGHVSALNFCRNHVGFEVFNLGTGVGYSVLEVISSFERVTGMKIKFQIVGRRPGDVAQCYCNPKKAKQMLHWQAKLGLDRMCLDSWNFAKIAYNGLNY